LDKPACLVPILAAVLGAVGADGFKAVLNSLAAVADAFAGEAIILAIRWATSLRSHLGRR
jgi:hypothetical protein